ncbi:GIY-YIG nuclease family protein [Paraburkholderia ginsengiterrae]|uniref:GIY-YIG nuclease family protein n=1 Tax=Paraburkholderia ginsengiterrae TaxID=1462993 RepID=UPI0013F4F857|nr:GIY-YIG nuclease family protein [Paraburkholderia ginsengiterrae]
MAPLIVIRPKTIQIYLPEGVPDGIRVAEFTMHLVKVTQVPRRRLAAYVAMPESANEGCVVYLLVGEDEDGREQLYVGQTANIVKRLDQHLQKEFWDHALIISSKTDNLTHSHTYYIEERCIQEAQTARRFVLENGNAGQRTVLRPGQQADCDDVLEVAKTLLAVLGYSIFDVADIASAVSSNREPLLSPDEPRFYFSRDLLKAEAIYTGAGLRVLKGATAVSVVSDAFSRHNYNRLRTSLIDKGVLAPQGDVLVFTQDYVFDSASAPLAVIRGQASSGPKLWMTAEGRTLKSFEEEQVKEAVTASPQDEAEI